jgi:putative transposase
VNALQLLLICLAGWLNGDQQSVIEYLREEVRVFKEQLGKKPRFTDDQRRRLAAKAKALSRDCLKQVTSIVTPETLLAWHRRLIAHKYDGSSRRSPGRPPTPAEIRELILTMAQQNRSWGYSRIQGALQNLGHEVGRGTIAKVLREAGIDPAPDRRKGTTWKEFLRKQWAVLGATDFFTVEVWTATGLVRYHVLFVMHLATRQVQIAGIIPEPDGRWMEQVARNLTDGLDGFLNGCLIHDRSSLFTAQWRLILESVGVKSVRLPPHSPNLNAYAERFVRTARETCLNQVVLIGEGSLRRVLSELMAHYHTERNHQSLGNHIIEPEVPEFPTSGPIQCRDRLGGMLHYYYRQSA